MTIERFHRFKNKGAEQVSYRGPDFNFCPQSLMQSAKEATAPLLDLIDGKSQNRRQVLCAVPVIMLEMVALIFKRVESLVLDFPARASTAHDLDDGTLR